MVCPDSRFARFVILFTCYSGALWGQCPSDPTPTGHSGKPALFPQFQLNQGVGTPPPEFAVEEYAFMTSGTHNQGLPSYTKWAPLIFAQPPGSPFYDFSSALVVNNPSNVNGVFVTVQYYDSSGTPTVTTNHFLNPEGTFTEPASVAGFPSGIGSAEVTSVGGPIVGSTLHHTDELLARGFGLLMDTEAVRSTCWEPTVPDVQPPGATCMQQLQAPQETPTVSFGPLPLTNTSPIDFYNGMAPIFGIVNTTNAVQQLTVVYELESPSGPITNTVNVSLNPRALLLERNLWDLFLDYHFNHQSFPGGYSWDFTIRVFGTANLIGEAVLFDGFADGFNTQGEETNLVQGRHFRMASAIMPNDWSDDLVNPELTQTAMLDTVTGVKNMSAQTVSITAEYRDRTGVLIGTDTATLAPHTSTYFGRGLSLNYPVDRFHAWTRIRGAQCDAELIGWTVRDVRSAWVNSEAWLHFHGDRYEYHKAYGEVLSGVNLSEPGPGLYENGQPYGAPSPFPGSVPFLRKVLPLVRVEVQQVLPCFTRAFWLGYGNFVSNGLVQGNSGAYFYRFFDDLGTDVTDYTPQNYPGLRWGETSFTYQDNDPPPLVLFSGRYSGRIDRVFQDPADRLDGIHTVGDPARELEIPGFPMNDQ